MANTKSAKKQILINKRNLLRNTSLKTRLKNIVKECRLSILGNEDEEAARVKLYRAQKVICESASKGIIKKETANRKVSRLYTLFNKKFANKTL